MLNIAICDDDDLIAHQIESVLHNIGDEENVKIDTDVFYSGNDLVREISSGKKFDLIYMDIQMENGDGITAAKNIRKKDEDAMIIFISSYDRYDMELFRLYVFSFIRKHFPDLPIHASTGFVRTDIFRSKPENLQ